MNEVRYYMPVATSRGDIWRRLRYVPICGWRLAFRGGGCE